ncbi:cob(I)yrinic acid a,c-diamide adenosyltransferase [Patescibacteria group bacterium]|nr:cob(I)yrinic acid a,c-diamide adenosyltransferase [Patescibacteria group bacterium]
MYYTGKGDKGTTKLFNSKDRVDKGEQIFEVLGSLDELNSWLGLSSVEAKDDTEILELIKKIQNDLFTCQAHFARSDVKIPEDFVSSLEEKIAKISEKIKPRDSFVLSGGSRLSANLDIARTLVRRAERQALKLSDEDKRQVNEIIFVYLNRLSSLLYVLARLANDIYEAKESKPQYSS